MAAMESWLAEALVSGSTYTVIGGVITIIGAGFTLVGGYISSQQKAQTDKALIAGNSELKAEVGNTKDALIAKGDRLAEVQAELATAQTALVTKTAENAKLSEKVAQVTETYAQYTMGTDSFIYLHVINFGKEKPEAAVVHVGKNPVRDTEVIVHDVTPQLPDIAAGLKRTFAIKGVPHRSTRAEVSHPNLNNALTPFLFEAQPKEENYFYVVRYYGATGSFKQLVNLAKVDGKWKQAYRVERLIGETGAEPIGQYFDPDFPVGANYLRRSERFKELHLTGALARWTAQQQ